MNNQYNLGSDLVSGPASKLDELNHNLVGLHYNLAAGLIVVLVLALIWLWYNSSKSSFNPGQTQRLQQLSGSIYGEGLDATGAQNATQPNIIPWSQSAFAQGTATDNAGLDIPSDFYVPNNPTMSPPYILGPGGVQFCASADQVPPNNAWAWMNGVANSSGGAAYNDSTDMNGNPTDVYGNSVSTTAATPADGFAQKRYRDNALSMIAQGH